MADLGRLAGKRVRLDTNGILCYVSDVEACRDTVRAFFGSWPRAPRRQFDQAACEGSPIISNNRAREGKMGMCDLVSLNELV